MLERYGVASYLGSDEISKNRNSLEIQQKIQNTKRNNRTFNSSSLEDRAYKMLNEKFKEVFKQYRSDLYPFNCDFYLKDIDMYIECNFHWTHGLHPFDMEKDKNKLEKWEKKAENSKFYKNAIKTWTVRDVKKRKIALENKLNFKEFFSFEEFKTWIDI